MYAPCGEPARGEPRAEGRLATIIIHITPLACVPVHGVRMEWQVIFGLGTDSEPEIMGI